MARAWKAHVHSPSGDWYRLFMSSKMKQFTQDDFELVATALTVGSSQRERPPLRFCRKQFSTAGNLVVRYEHIAGDRQFFSLARKLKCEDPTNLVFRNFSQLVFASRAILVMRCARREPRPSPHLQTPGLFVVLSEGARPSVVAWRTTPRAAGAR